MVSEEQPETLSKKKISQYLSDQPWTLLCVYPKDEINFDDFTLIIKMTNASHELY